MATFSRPFLRSCIFCMLIVLASVTQSQAQSPAAPPDYSHLFPRSECNRQAWLLGLRGYDSLRANGLVRNDRYLSIIDYTKRSNVPRFFLIDMRKGRLVLSSMVAHGFGSDPDSSTIPYRFSNRDGSKATSLGFYLTGDVYTNHRPCDSLGLCLFGLDSGYNDAAAAREIVMHYGATEFKGVVYVTDTGAGRSSGCPALPLSKNTDVINRIKGGSVLFLYSNKVPGYAGTSTVLTGRLRLPITQQGPPPNNCRCVLKKSLVESR